MVWIASPPCPSMSRLTRRRVTHQRDHLAAICCSDASSNTSDVIHKHDKTVGAHHLYCLLCGVRKRKGHGCSCSFTPTVVARCLTCTAESDSSDDACAECGGTEFEKICANEGCKQPLDNCGCAKVKANRLCVCTSCAKPRGQDLPSRADASLACSCESFESSCILDHVQHFQLRSDQVRGGASGAPHPHVCAPTLHPNSPTTSP